MQKSVFEAPALQVRLELFDDEVGERDTFGIKAFEKPQTPLDSNNTRLSTDLDP